jgi:hypothetical protein
VVEGRQLSSRSEPYAGNPCCCFSWQVFPWNAEHITLEEPGGAEGRLSFTASLRKQISITACSVFSPLCRAARTSSRGSRPWAIAARTSVASRRAEANGESTFVGLALLPWPSLRSCSCKRANRPSKLRRHCLVPFLHWKTYERFPPAVMIRPKPRSCSHQKAVRSRPSFSLALCWARATNASVRRTRGMSSLRSARGQQRGRCQRRSTEASKRPKEQ